MLAEAARKANLKPLVIDLFADIDMQGLAEDYCQVKSLAIEHIAPAIGYFVEKYAATEVIYGSGLEYFPESVSYLDHRLTILGNDSVTFNRLLDKKSFFENLVQWDIQHPEVSFVKPGHAGEWLIKPLRGQGGLGIKRYQGNDADSLDVYWQKYQSGYPQSVLFLADGKSLSVVSFNSQWSVSRGRDNDFAFSGIINDSCLNPAQKQKIAEWLRQLVALYQLKGVNTLDFIQDGENSYVLEINPRPSASMVLYGGELINSHIQASRGCLADDRPVQPGYSGYQIVYARQNLVIPEAFRWPEACSDIPETQAIINAAQPICSIIAHQNEAHGVIQQLSTLEHTILNELERFQTHAI